MLRRATKLHVLSNHQLRTLCQYRGPGGLTAEQIFGAVKQSSAQDAARKAAPKSTGAEGLSAKGLNEMSVRQLQQLLSQHKISTAGCIEKDDLLEKAAALVVR